MIPTFCLGFSPQEKETNPKVCEKRVLSRIIGPDNTEESGENYIKRCYISYFTGAQCLHNRPNDRDSKNLRNVGQFLRDYRAQR
jgi:hypothetical protein